MTHALLSPSGADRWVSCPGSVALTKDIPRSSSKYADEGTDAHHLAALCLNTKTDASGYVGQIMPLGNIVQIDTAKFVQSYVDSVRELAAQPGASLLVEQSLPIHHLTGEADAHGTADAVVLTDTELTVVDLKYGQGVEVSAVGNLQLQMYALAALEQYSLLHDVATVHLVIHQPRLYSISRHTMAVAELQGVGELIKVAAVAAQLPDALLMPSVKGCRWCPAKATCPALATAVTNVCDSTPDRTADALGKAMAFVELATGWCKAVQTAAFFSLQTGQAVTGYKLVQGRKGARAWVDAAQAETVLKGMRLSVSDIYDKTVISPTTAAALLENGTISATRWTTLTPLIYQKDGALIVVPVSDKRAALVTQADALFTDVTQQN